MYYLGGIDQKTGERVVYRVRDDGFSATLNPRLDLRNHSPTGFQWGYGGSGPAQLALALLADHLGDDERALTLYQDFKWKVIAALPQDKGWTLDPEQIDAALSVGATV
jgi:hypothetical protein